MNRIILIGNGFDLAHGLKTSYNDFIDWIIEEKYKLLEENKYNYEDEDIKYSPGPYKKGIKLEDVKKRFLNSSKSKQKGTIYSYRKNTDFDIGSVIYKNNFLESIIDSRYIQGWADIETIFYDELNQIIDNSKSTDDDIKVLNNNFKRVINLLEEYLCIVKHNGNLKISNVNDRISYLLNVPIFKSDLSIEYLNNNPPLNGEFEQLGEKIRIPNLKNYDKCLILDFNYTQTIKYYFDIVGDKFHYINIHGELNNEDNPMIFGFGDELDEKYTIIERSRLQGVMSFIKSIKYLDTVNYRNVLEFLEIDKFQVFIWGHSCGLTDRTLLNHIFEHDNCTGIKPYYYKKYDEDTGRFYNNYTELAANLSRNFKNKNKLRDRVVNFDYCEPLIM